MEFTTAEILYRMDNYEKWFMRLLLLAALYGAYKIGYLQGQRDTVNYVVEQLSQTRSSSGESSSWNRSL